MRRKKGRILILTAALALMAEPLLASSLVCPNCRGTFAAHANSHSCCDQAKTGARELPSPFDLPSEYPDQMAGKACCESGGHDCGGGDCLCYSHDNRQAVRPELQAASPAPVLALATAAEIPDFNPGADGLGPADFRPPGPHHSISVTVLRL